MTLVNPFDDLDNLMIASIFSFIEASDALQLARSSRRLFNIFNQSPNNRLSHRYDTVILDFAQNQNVPWKIRLDNTTAAMPTKPLFVTFAEKPLENPDFFISEQTPLLELYAKLDKCSHKGYLDYYSEAHPFWMGKNNFKKPVPTLKCHVKVGDDRYGMIVLFKFLQERFALDQLFVDEADAETLNYLALFPLPLVRHLQVFPKMSHTEDAVLRLIREMPQLKELTLRGSKCSFSSAFYDEPAIRQLTTFGCFDATCDADFTQVKWRNFVFFNGILSSSSITVKGIKFLLEEWKADERQIDFWLFDFTVGTLSCEEAADQILEGAFNRKLEKNCFPDFIGVLKSGSGKELKVQVVNNCDPDLQLLLTTMDNWQAQWRDFLFAFSGNLTCS